MFHLGVGRSQTEWKLKVKTQISVFPWAKIGKNDHSNPYIESTTVLSNNTFPDGVNGLLPDSITKMRQLLKATDK